MTGPANLLAEWGRLLVSSLEGAGLELAVISPGSRSTAIAFALLRNPAIRCVSAIDERDAAFYAVGHARMTGRPVALVCTSGSAGAHYHPAVVEASRAGVPLLVVTADRPFELQEADAPQTIDQIRLYGGFARAFLDPGMPDPHPDALAGLQRVAAQALHATLAPRPGPVQFNVRARKPLEPRDAADSAGRALAADVDALIARGPTRPTAVETAPAAGSLTELAVMCRSARRGVIVCGPIDPHEAAAGAVSELARRTGFPVLCEAASQIRFGAADRDILRVDAFDTMLRCAPFADALRPEIAIEVGAPPTSSAWRDYVRRPDASPRFVFSSRGWSDPHSRARLVTIAPLRPALSALLEDITAAGAEPAPDEAWLAWLRGTLDAAWSATDEALDREQGLPEGRAVRVVLETLPPGSILALGNSLPIREVDTFCRASRQDLLVWSQRGANGIDGLIAGAAGAAAAAGRPTTLLLGDVSLQHDIGGLALARETASPLAIVVLDNEGGRIFEQLPLASTRQLEPEAFRYWTTPPRIDPEHAARAFDVRYRATDDPDALGDALREALATDSATLIHARLDGSRTTPLHEAVWTGAAARIAAIPEPPPLGR